MPRPPADSPRIALISRRYPPLIGGAEAVTGYLAAALAEAGASVSVATCRDPAGLDASSPGSAPGGPGVPRVDRLRTSRLRGVGTFLYMRNLSRWLAANPVDLAYVSMLKHDAFVALGVGRRLGFPVVLRPEGAGATGDLAWQSWGRFGRAIGRRCRSADAFVAISPAIRSELVAAGYDPTRVVDLPNGVPVPKQPWIRRPGWRESPRAAFVGRLAAEKGLDTLIDAWPLVLSADPHARLTLIGDGPGRPALEAQVARLGLSGSVDLPGSSPDPSSVLRGCDLFVLPSREEGMSIALLEAMALRIPIVATSIRGNRRLVVDCKHGRLAPPDDPGALARAILAQWSDFDRAAHMGEAARKRVEAEYSAAAVARRHLELFGRLIEARKDRAVRTPAE